jgi:large subunit ribosomal protein L13
MRGTGKQRKAGASGFFRVTGGRATMDEVFEILRPGKGRSFRTAGRPPQRSSPGGGRLPTLMRLGTRCGDPARGLLGTEGEAADVVTAWSDISRGGGYLDNSRKPIYDLGLPFFGSGGKGSMRTVVPSARDIERRWHVIDADGRVLGRVATVAARLLQGKHKPGYTPFLDTGDHVVIINAAGVRLTGRKDEQKLYRYHSGYEGGLREERAKDLRQRNPVRMVEEAVRGMLPKTKLGNAMYRKLKVYARGDHPHAAQKPVKLEVA